MATAITIIDRALRLIGAKDAYESLDAASSQDAMEVLNAMLAEWYEADVGIPEFQFDSVTDTLASGNADAEALSYQLALRLAPEYGQPITPEIAQMAYGTMHRLRLRYFQPGRVDPALPSTRQSYDVDAG